MIVTLNTDDPGMFGCDLAGEFRIAEEVFGLESGTIGGPIRFGIGHGVSVQRKPVRTKLPGSGRGLFVASRPRAAICAISSSLRRGVRYRFQRIAEHRGAERASRRYRLRARRHQFLGAREIDALAFLFAEEHLSAARAAAERFLPMARRFQQFAGRCQHVARLVVDAAIAAQIAGIVIDDLFASLGRQQASCD